MSDPRFVDTRCHEAFTVDALRRNVYRCEFRAGHDGLHSAGSVAEEGSYEPKPCEPMRWGTESQLAQEIELREPDGIIAINGDVTPAFAEAIRKALRRGGCS